MKNIVVANCSLCGTPVCKVHYQDGLCTDCKRGKIIDELPK